MRIFVANLREIGFRLLLVALVPVIALAIMLTSVARYLHLERLLTLF